MLDLCDICCPLEITTITKFKYSLWQKVTPFESEYEFCYYENVTILSSSKRIMKARGYSIIEATTKLNQMLVEDGFTTELDSKKIFLLNQKIVGIRK